MQKLLLSGALALIGLAAPAASVLAPAAASPATPAAVAAPSSAAASAGTAVPGLYHVPIIGKVALPGVVGSLLGGGGGGGNGSGLRRATAVASSNWAGYADTNDTFNSVSSSWREPAVNCADSTSGPEGLLSMSSLLGGPDEAAAFWVGLDGYNSTSVEQLGTDSDCDSGTPSYYAWYEMYPNPSVALPSQYPVKPGDQMTTLVAANSTGTSFVLSIKDATAGWMFSTTQTGSGFARSSAEVIAEAPSSCSIQGCNQVPLADFGQIDYSGSSVIDAAGTKGSPASFDATEITMSDNGTTLATPTSLSSDGSSFSVAWNAS